MGTGKKLIMKPRQILLLAAIGFGQAGIFLLPYMQYTFYKPMQAALHCSNEQLGFLITLYGIFEVIGFLPGGWIADRFPVRKIITTCLILTSIACIFAAIFTQYTVYCVIWVFIAIVNNMVYWSSATKAVRMVGNPEEQGKAYGYFYLFNSGITNGSYAVCLVVLAAIGASTIMGFRAVLVLFAALALAAAAVIWIVLGRQSNASQIAPSADKVAIKDILKVLMKKEVWMVGIIAFCCYSLVSLSTYFTPYFSDVMKLGVASAGAIYVITGPFQAVFGPIMGTISDFIGSTVKTVIGVMIVIISSIAVMLICGGTLTLVGAIIIDCLVTILAAGIYEVQFSMIEETGMDRKVGGSCIAAASVIAYLPDVFLYTLFGSWLDKYGNAGYSLVFKYGLAVAALAIVISIILLLSIKKGKKNVAECKISE